jgi:glycosyltransferase involved in cell wall biosynthesis
MKIGIYLSVKHLGSWSWDDFQARRLAVSGTDALSLFLAAQLPHRGFEVVVFSPNPGQDSGSVLQQRVESLATAVRLSRQDNLSLLLFNNTGNEETLEGIRACTESAQDVVVVDHNGPSPLMADALAACQQVRRVICVSQSQAQGVRDHPVFRKIEVINNPLLASSERLPVPRDPLGVAFLGSLTPSKGFHHLAAAWPAVRSACPGASLGVIGSAKLYDRDQMLGSLGVAEAGYEAQGICPYLGPTRADAAALGVRFLGLLTPGEVQNELRRISVCVVNPNCRTSTETFCVSAIEASASGAAVVGARYGGLRETVADGHTGVLIKSPSDLAPAVLRLLRHPKLASGLGESGRAYVAHKYGQERIVGEWCDTLSRTVQGQPPMPPPFRFDGGVRPLVREAIRLLRELPGLHWLPPLSHVRQVIRGPWRRQGPPA